MNVVAAHLPGLALPSSHPLGGREAYQCLICGGIFFPEIAPPDVCPYCVEDDEAA